MANSIRTAASAAIVTPTAYFYNDTYEKKEWYLDGSTLSPLSIDIYSVWKDYTGSGVKIGVIDSQIDFRHRDLSRAYDTSRDYNFALNSADVTVTDANLPYFHGTAVAGVIAAQAGNGVGTAGIASGATLVGLGIDYSSDAVDTQILSALRAAASVDVANSSWSFVTNFEDDFGAHPEYADAIRYAVGQGRGGLGTVLVFAAGNAGTSGTSNYHNFQNSPLAIAVGAVNPDGTAAGFTSLGANVLVSAGGADIYTTTLKDRFTSYSGTSFAAPAVSGAVGLMLQANPDLGYRDVQQILAYSAQREGLAAGANFGDGWRTNGATNFNGGGLHFSDAFGYGMLNVHDAVRLAETWTDRQTLANLATVTGSVRVEQQLVAGSNDHIAARIHLDQAIDIEHVQLALDLRWTNTGNLDVYLTSPDGTRVRLVYDLPGSERAGSLRGFSFDSVASLGEQSAGDWTIDVYNRTPGALAKDGSPMSGLFQDAALTVTGSSTGRANDVYIYTDEFATLYSGSDLTRRSVLADSDGGCDTINAAAVTSCSTIDLSGASRTVIAGVTLSFAAGSIENAFGGDGADKLIGSAAANDLRGGRGDDVITFSAGNDRIDGGAGSDRLVINAALGSVTGQVLADGSLSLAVRAGEASTVRGIESFAFSDGVRTYQDLVTQLSHAAPTAAVTAAATTGRLLSATMIGTDGADKLKGGAGADHIDGGAGNDRLLGGAGDDWLVGGLGRDKLSGDAGADTFVFDLSRHDSADQVLDFSAAEGDRLMVTGYQSGATFDFASHDGATWLEMHFGGQTVDVARIGGTDIDAAIAALTASAVDHGILWA